MNYSNHPEHQVKASQAVQPTAKSLHLINLTSPLTLAISQPFNPPVTPVTPMIQ